MEKDESEGGGWGWGTWWANKWMPVRGEREIFGREKKRGRK